MKLKKSSKQWAESRGAALVGSTLKPSHDAENLLDDLMGDDGE